MDEIANYSESVFEDIKHVNEYSQEFWCARELQIALEYKQWRRFQMSMPSCAAAWAALNCSQALLL